MVTMVLRRQRAMKPRRWIYTVWQCRKSTGQETCIFWVDKKKHAKEWTAAKNTRQVNYKIKREWFADLI